MSTTISSVPFAGTEEQAKRLDEVIAAYKGRPGALIPVLQKAQIKRNAGFARKKSE